MSLDFSAKTELCGLARVASALEAAAAPIGVEFFLMGAAARDLILRHAYGIDTRRVTKDVDFAVMVRDWNAYDALRFALIQAKGGRRASGYPFTHTTCFKVCITSTRSA